MNERIYLDCNAMVGPRGPKDSLAPSSTGELLEEMEWCGIHGALIGHAAGKEYDPSFGNRLLLRELRKSSRLFGLWAVMPHHTGEMAPPREVVREMLDHGIRAARMTPRAHRYPFNVEYCGGLLKEFEENGILLVVEGGNLMQPDLLEPGNQVLMSELDAVLTTFPGLHVLLQDARWDATRWLFWLMNKHPHLLLELSNHQGNRAMEVFTAAFGSGRILFGTGAPERTPGASRAFLDYAVLDEAAKERIASGNLARLLKLESLPGPYRKKPPADPILAAAKAGEPVRRTPVIDAHAHIGHDGASGTGWVHMPDSDGARMHERAALLGIRQMCISSFLAIWVDPAEGNGITRNAMKRYPGFYQGYASLMPQYVTDWPRELRRVHRSYGMDGLKPYFPRTFMPYNDRAWAPWFEYGNRMRAYVLLHPSSSFEAEVNDVAPRYPGLTFIMAHMGASWPEARMAVGVAKKNPNVVLEITQTAVTHRIIEYMVQEAGADRVLFGTDQPMRDPAPQFGWVAYSHCTYEEKKKVLGLNMRRIMKRVRR